MKGFYFYAVLASEHRRVAGISDFYDGTAYGASVLKYEFLDIVSIDGFATV